MPYILTFNKIKNIYIMKGEFYVIIKKTEDVKMQNYEEELINLLNDKEVSNKSNIIADINTFKSIDIEKEIDKCGYNKKEVSDFILKTQKYTEENSKLEINEKMIEESYIAARSILLENKISKEKEIIFLFGLPASGKTTILNKIIKKYDKNFYILDSDVYKTGLKNKKGNIIFPFYLN